MITPNNTRGQPAPRSVVLLLPEAKRRTPHVLTSRAQLTTMEAINPKDSKHGFGSEITIADLPLGVLDV
jgi:hypothetical protein